ncbi:MAG: hypothetical protein AAFR36_24920 [Bacteroidota bacterium]
MLRFALILVLACGQPTSTPAHSWQDEVAPLSENDVEKVVTWLETRDSNLELSPNQSDSIEFLIVTSVEMSDDDRSAMRTLLMFEAIRQGVIVSGRFINESDALLWADLISVDDFEHVSNNYERLEAWFNALFEEDR